MKRGEKRFLYNLLLGVVGGIVGGWVFGLLNITTGSGFVGSMITSLAGALPAIPSPLFFKTLIRLICGKDTFGPFRNHRQLQCQVLSRAMSAQGTGCHEGDRWRDHSRR